MKSPYTTFGMPPDAVAWWVLASALLALFAVLRFRRVLERRVGSLSSRAALGALAVLAALLSVGYIAYYLRGGPRIIDATGYFLEGRALAKGYLAFPTPEPSASFDGRFLLRSPLGGLAVIFPPGYPALLALGFLLHAPLAVGPLLAFGLTLSTYALARELFADERVARLAALLSVVCAALRYHTADTMSHGLCALLLSAGLVALLRGTPLLALVAGAAFGWLFATRPITGVIGLCLAAWLLAKMPRRVAWFALGVVPGFLLLLAHQHAATGNWFASVQLRYYALADGPPGCFRYGFGSGIGCRFEHGDFVRARLGAGFGPVQALATSLRRLLVHSIDIANAAPLALFCPYAVWAFRRQRGVGLIGAGTFGLMLAYAPFYFEASYPGGGARLFADVLPFEHVLLAAGLVRSGLARFALPVALSGFALHASFSHRALAEREGGQPMFDARVLASAGVTRGLVFVNTDHGYDLGHDPGVLDAREHVIVARLRRDAHDRVLWEHLGRPPSYRYLFTPAGEKSEPALVPYMPEASPELRYEAEAEWPPTSVSAGWVHPDFEPCASSGAGLRLVPVAGWSSVLFRLTPPIGGSYAMTTGWGAEQPIGLHVRLKTTELPSRLTGRSAGCQTFAHGSLDLGTETVDVEISVAGQALLDYVELEEVPKVPPPNAKTR